MTMADSSFRQLPAVHEVLADAALEAALKDHDRGTVVDAVRAELERLREFLRAGTNFNGAATVTDVATRVGLKLRQARQPKLREVVNATGILLHTNLGR